MRIGAFLGIAGCALLAIACTASEAPVEITTQVVAGDGATQVARDGFRIEGGGIHDDTIDHVATVVTPEDQLRIYHFDQGTTYCYAIFAERFGSTGCSGNDQLALGKPFLRRTQENEPGDFFVWLSGAPASAAFFVVETDTDAVFASEVVNGTGFAILTAGGTPIEAQLLDADGDVLWTDKVRT